MFAALLRGFGKREHALLRWIAFRLIRNIGKIGATHCVDEWSRMARKRAVRVDRAVKKKERPLVATRTQPPAGTIQQKPALAAMTRDDARLRDKSLLADMRELVGLRVAE